MNKVVLSLFILSMSLIEAVQPAPAEALERLISGNQRFAEGQSKLPDLSAERRAKLTELQEPFAVVLGCSDSRVSPEIIFNQGLGDLFVVRVAGNVLGPVVLESIEYAAMDLHSAIVVVLGHQNCGAVTAALQEKGDLIEAITLQMTPSIEESKTQAGGRLENGIKDNVLYMVKQLKESASLAKLIDQKKLGIVGGYYDFQSGKVQILSSLLPLNSVKK